MKDLWDQTSNIFSGDEKVPSDGLARRGAALKAKDTLPINHLEIFSQVARWVNRQLEK